jgi:cytochrome P450
MTETLSSILSKPFPWGRPPIDPPDVYRALREQQPIARVRLFDGRPAWLITRYDDVRAILSDPRVSADDSRPGFPAFGDTPPIGARVFLRMDAPDHTVFRRMLSKNFMVRRIEAMRPDIQRLVDETIDRMLASTERSADLVQELALPVPSTVLSWVLGVHPEDRVFFNKAAERLTRDQSQLLRDQDQADPQVVARLQQTMLELTGYVAKVVAEKEAQDDPGNDILGELVKAARADTIPREEVISNGFVFLIAGHDTTASMTALGTLTLLQHPDQMAELRSDPSLIPNAIEEMLRFLTIVDLVVVRVAAEDIEIGGQVIPAGEGIIPLNSSANRDDAQFPDAAAFDIHRDPQGHFAFGFGVHQCIGQPLARVELGIIFETLLRRIPTLKLAAPVEDLEFRLRPGINGVFKLPVTW